jgi:hypothetical protein
VGDEVVIVSAADSGYFPLLRELVLSIRDKEAGRAAPIGVFDLGLAADERTWLAAYGVAMAEPGWDVDFPRRKQTPLIRKAQIARPFLRRYFPGYATYLWIDADAWVQDWRAVELFFRAAADGRLAIVPELDRAYRNFFHAWDEFHGVIRRGYLAAFDAATADRLVRHPLLNNGAFALAAGAPHWQAWAQTLHGALQRSRNELIDQATLNHVVYAQSLPAHFLPAWCNWISHHAAPLRERGTGALVEPNLPHQRLGIVHLTMWMKSRRDLRYAGGTPAAVAG